MIIKKMHQIINFSNSNLLLNNGGFFVNYSPELGRPIWTTYSLNKNDIEKHTGKRTRFVCDKRLIDKNIYQLKPNSPVFNYNLTRGHLVPAFMMSHLKSTSKSWQKTFLMSNIVPQHRNLNMNSWHKLEIYTKKLISSINFQVHVLVGCDSITDSKKYLFTSLSKRDLNIELLNNLVWIDTIKQIEYSIPNIFYQVIVTEYEVKCWIGFNNSNQVVNQVSLDFLEKLIDKKLLI
jgi:DNA/RNA endonuclease G (NUC1)